MGNVEWYIDVVYKDETTKTFGPYDTETECHAEWKKLAKDKNIKSITKRKVVEHEP